ncbi:MAG: glycosyltransferase family 4 protein [Microcoleaceae cyanobacterium]
MKVLLSAFACEPGQGSEPGVGWNVAVEMAKSHQVWILTLANNQSLIEAELAQNPIPNLHFIYIDVLNWSQAWPPGKVGKSVRLHYYLWQIRVYFAARQLHQEINFDLMHHVTYVQYSSPSFLSLLPVPFLWGSVGGGESAPKPFWSGFSLRGRVFETVRDGVRRWSERGVWVRQTAKHSTIALATTSETAQRLKRIGCQQVHVLGIVGLSSSDINTLAQLPTPPSQPFRFVSIGRLLHWKGFHLGLQAFAQLNLPQTEYWIIGSGPEESRLKVLAETLGIAQKVKFWGALSRLETLSKLGETHTLVHPSLHDSGGCVCLEAMAAKRPVLCLDLGGPGDMITPETGIKVTPNHPQQVVEDLALAMGRLVEDRQLYHNLGQAGQLRVQQFYHWTVKAERINQFYRTIVQSEATISNQEKEISCEF